MGFRFSVPDTAVSLQGLHLTSFRWTLCNGIDIGNDKNVDRKQITQVSIHSANNSGFHYAYLKPCLIVLFAVDNGTCDEIHHSNVNYLR